MLFNLVLKHLLPSCLSGYLTPVYLLTPLWLPLTQTFLWPLGSCVCVCVSLFECECVCVLNSIWLYEWAYIACFSYVLKVSQVVNYGLIDLLSRL